MTTSAALEVRTLAQYGAFVAFIIAAFRAGNLEGLHLVVSNKGPGKRKVVTFAGGKFTVYYAGRGGKLGEKVASFPLSKVSRLAKALNVVWLKKPIAKPQNTTAEAVKPTAKAAESTAVGGLTIVKE